jgi:uncharacterized RDD family membrane protein YckC
MTKRKAFALYNRQRLEWLEGKELASFKRRAIAFFIDVVISFFLFFLVLMVVGFFIWYRQTGGEFSTYTFSFDIHSFYGRLLLNILVPILYFGLSMFISNGKTIGKKICRLRVLSLSGEQLGLWTCFERALGYGASIFELGIGFLQYFFHPNRRTAQDCLAETIVVLESS